MKLEITEITYKSFNKTHFGNAFINNNLKIELSETNKLVIYKK